LRREAKANKIKLQESEIPKLWILTPTISETRLSSFGTIQKESWLSGVHFLADALRTAIVAIHQLPQTPETLWLRLLGRGSVQSQAIIELQALPLDHPYQKATLELVYNLRENLRVNQELETDDRELIMRLEPLYQRNREQAKEEGRQEGKQEGKQEGEKNLILRLLHRRIGEIDSLLIERITGLSIEQLENLGEALLDFSSVADLEAWLTQHSI
jgi:predicted transposase/invertase (TIGR01784 family)